MKKVLAAVLALVLVCSVALAEGIDLKAMSVDDLIALKTQIAGELMSRGEIKSVPVPPGEYICGVDIPAGSYRITAYKMLLIVKNGYEDMNTIDAGESIGKFTIKEGDTVSITGGTAEFEVYSGLGF